MSTHNICFRREIRKILCGYPLLSVAMIRLMALVSCMDAQMYRSLPFICQKHYIFIQFQAVSGFIQARPSQIQGLFKDFSRTNFKFSRTIILTQIRKIWHCHSLLPHPVKTFGLKKIDNFC